jgi:hypothetical protein
MPRERTSLLQGTLDLIVLQLLNGEPTNGYDLTQPREPGTDPRRMGIDPEWPPREGLLPLRRRPQATRRRAGKLAPLLRRPRRHPEEGVMQ